MDIIGGADWPTAAFLLSRSGLGRLSVGLLVLLAAAVYFILRRNKK